MRYRNLGRTGASLSVIGFGASPLGDVFGTIDPRESQRAVDDAIDHGINFFDVSPFYGETLAEQRLGDMLSGSKRDQVFLATKCGRYTMDGFDFSAGRIHRSIDESLTRLRTTYVDLFQAHDVEFGSTDQIIEETIPALRAIQQQGKARFIGITGYSLIQLRTIATQANVDTILSYCRYNLMVSDLDTLLTPFARDRGLGLINASPLHMGLLAGAVPPWHPAPAAVRETGAAVAQLCKKYGVDPAVVALRFCLDHPYITSTLVGMATTAQVSTNLKALDANLDPQLLVRINQMIAPVHDTLWPSGRPENADNPAVHESHV